MGLTIAPSRISEVSPSQMEAHKSQMCGYGRKNIQIESPGKDLYGCVDDSGSLATQVTIDDFLVDVRLSGNELTDYNTIKDQLEAIITSIRVNELSS